MRNHEWETRSPRHLCGGLRLRKAHPALRWGWHPISTPRRIVRVQILAIPLGAGRHQKEKGLLTNSCLCRRNTVRTWRKVSCLAAPCLCVDKRGISRRWRGLKCFRSLSQVVRMQVCEHRMRIRLQHDGQSLGASLPSHPSHEFGITLRQDTDVRW